MLYKVYPYESPRWLWLNNKPEEAGEILYYYYKPWVIGEVLKVFELDAAANRNRESVVESGEHSEYNEYEMFRKPRFAELFTVKHRRVLIIAIILPILTNFSGINYVLLYATTFFLALDGGDSNSILLT